MVDRTGGARVFSTPEQIGRILLLAFLLVSTIRTFFWYFEATLPAPANQQWTPSLAPSRDALWDERSGGAIVRLRAGGTGGTTFG